MSNTNTMSPSLRNSYSYRLWASVGGTRAHLLRRVLEGSSLECYVTDAPPKGLFYVQVFVKKKKNKL